MSCGGLHGGLSPDFAHRVTLLLVHEELRGRLPLAPSLEVFAEEHRREEERAGRHVAPRETMRRLLQADRF